MLWKGGSGTWRYRNIYMLWKGGSSTWRYRNIYMLWKGGSSTWRYRNAAIAAAGVSSERMRLTAAYLANDNIWKSEREPEYMGRCMKPHTTTDEWEEKGCGKQKAMPGFFGGGGSHHISVCDGEVGIAPNATRHPHILKIVQHAIENMQ